MVGAIWFVCGLVVGLVVYSVFKRRPPGSGKTSAPADNLPSSDADVVEDDPRPVQERLLQLKREVEAQDEHIQRPADLLANPQFNEAVALLAGPHYQSGDVLDYLGAQGYVLPSMAAVALPRRQDTDPAAVVATVPRLGGYALHFVLDYLQTLPNADLLHALLKHAREWWWDFQPFRQRLQQYLRWATEQPNTEDSVDFNDVNDEALQVAKETLKHFRDLVPARFLQLVDEEQVRRRELRVLGGFGRVLAAPSGRRFAHPRLQEQIDLVDKSLRRDGGAGSVLVSGEHGVGKSVLIDAACERLLADGWLVFEASAAEILAGQSHVGELEGRIREMLHVLHRPRAIWRVPDFHDLLKKGAHSQDPRGILDLVMPAIERRELRVLGEIAPRQLAQLTVARPQVHQLFDVAHLPPADPETVRVLTGEWAKAQAIQWRQPVADAATLAEAERMAAQFFPEQHEPGRVLRLLDDALQAATTTHPPALPMDADDLMQAVAARSGLPLDVIDDRQSLDLAKLRDFFLQRVMGQDEAVECLLDRIAMVKAGLTDSSRPIGVFLFAGPTGTGKTELAKALGELLFGSAERVLRLDMSEFQTEDSAWRLLDDGSPDARSLVTRIREQPFSVLLLDEFEKAHPRVWDLFLQVFDDARLSGRSGNTVDFRHCIIILTSNAGSTIQRNAGPGFTASGGHYSRSAVEKAIYETFRREFINRLDRVVLFNPLDRGLMRGILHKELDRVLTRRGLRMRDWAMEWEPSAIEFLLDKGFTPDLGARPLRRAIEHHLLAPLARRIVEHRAPEGGQFLFVRSAGNELEVLFIDPNARNETPVATAAPAAETHDLRGLMHTPATGPSVVSLLQRSLSALQERVDMADWQEDRATDFGELSADGFWSRPDRFAVLDRIERRDRIESALDSAQRMHRRLSPTQGNAAFCAQLSQLLYLLDLAVNAVIERRPQDALLVVDAGGAETRATTESRDWWTQLLAMYGAWAARRNMRIEVLKQDAERACAWLAVSGFGAYDCLRPEAGLHVLELEQPDQTIRRISAQVRVDPDLPGQPRVQAAASGNSGQEPRVCRRYRPMPSPLVRDGVRGWRTGRLDRVMNGEFDVMPAESDG